MGTSHDADFEKLVDGFARFMLKTYPVNATLLGVHDYDEELGDYTPSGLKNKEQRLKTFKKNFKAVNRRMLSEENGVDLDLILGRIEAELLLHSKWPPHNMQPGIYLNEIFYGVYSLISREFAPARDRAIAATRRLCQAPILLKQARKQLKNPPQIFVESAIDTCEGAKAFFKVSVPEFASQVRGALNEALLEVNDEILEELDSFSEYLTDELLPQAKPNFQIGKTIYNLLLKHEHHLSMSSDKLLKLANTAIKGYEKELNDVAKQISKKKDWRQIVDDVKKDHPTIQGLVGAYRKEMRRARSFVVKQDLMTVPEGEDINVITTPSFAKPLIPYADYIPPAALDDLQQGTFWVSTPTGLTPQEASERLRGHSKWAIPLIALHEAYPGHHLQRVHANRQERLIRHIITSPLLTEGWAHYCEEMMWEQKFIDNPKHRLLQLKDAVWRALRVIIDIGLQAKTLNVTQAVNMLVEKAGLEAPHAEAEVQRYCQTPTQPMTFLIGKLEIDALLADYRNKMGDDFSLKTFHDELLSFGSIPVSKIRTLMEL